MFKSAFNQNINRRYMACIYPKKSIYQKYKHNRNIQG